MRPAAQFLSVCLAGVALAGCNNFYDGPLAVGDGGAESAVTPAPPERIDAQDSAGSGSDEDARTFRADGAGPGTGGAGGTFDATAGGGSGSDARPGEDVATTSWPGRFGLAVTQMALGQGHTCALLSDRSIWCWGWNVVKELANTGDRLSLRPTKVSVAAAVAIAAGGYGTFAKLADGSVWSWGDNSSGHLGNGETPSGNAFLPPGKVVNLAAPTSIASGDRHACGVLTQGSVACWGLLGPPAGATGTPAVVSGVDAVTSLALGPDYTCAVISDGTVRCWGVDFISRMTTNVPSVVAGVSGATALAAGALHACVLRAGGIVQCWGQPHYGVLGMGSVAGPSQETMAVAGLADARAIAAGENHNCALDAKGLVWCWGKNDRGQLGNGTSKNASIPEQVPGLPPVTAIYAGTTHTCVVLPEGSIRCWGENVWGQLGNGKPISHESSPVQVVF